MTDKYLCTLWSKAVRAEKGEFCMNPLCGKLAHSTHHIIKRRYMTTRYDTRNGLPLCADCHRIADRNAEFAMRMISDDDREHLADMGMYTLKDWLLITQQTREEFMKFCADDLKEKINS